MTYEELKTKLNDLPHSRKRAEIIDAIYEAAVQTGHETVSAFIETRVKEFLLGVQSPSSLFEDPERETLREKALRIVTGPWAMNGFPGSRDPISMKEFLEDPTIHMVTYDELTPPQQRKWNVAAMNHRRCGGN